MCAKLLCSESNLEVLSDECKEGSDSSQDGVAENTLAGVDDPDSEGNSRSEGSGDPNPDEKGVLDPDEDGDDMVRMFKPIIWAQALMT